MSKVVYTTEELIQILREERKACLNGKRLNLAATPKVGNPVIDCFLKPEGIQKFTAYQHFKAAVHQYQLEYQVSGLVWREIAVRGKTLRFPQIDDQLMGLTADFEILKAAKADVLTFWQDVTVGMDLFLSLNGGKEHQPIQAQDVDVIAQRTQWAGLWTWEKSNFRQMLLQLGWGQPFEASDRRGWPNSGSEDIYAVNPGQKPIG